jgi:hypothetical protein
MPLFPRNHEARQSSSFSGIGIRDVGIFKEICLKWEFVLKLGFKF